MSVLCIVTCGQRKIWDDHPEAGPTQAWYAYSGPLHRACQRYARKFHPDAWCILSAKHGFLYPTDVVPENYDVAFDLRDQGPISIDELKQQARDKKLTLYDRVVALGGRRYVGVVRQVFVGTSVDVHAPLEGLGGIGYMMQALNKAVEDRRPL